MFHPAGFENTLPDGFSVLEVVYKPDDATEPRLFVPLRRTELSGSVAGPLADLLLTQTFGYTSEQCDKTLEALYRFPLPGDAAVTGVTVRFGEVSIHAELKERVRAEADYTDAKWQGKQAALATRESPDVFTLSVVGLQPDQEIVVETRYVQLACMEGPDWTLRIPLTTSPRYVREDEANSRHASGQPLALLRDPGHHFALDLKLQAVGKVESPTHSLSVMEEEESLRVRLSEGEVLPDRDCVLRWQAKQDDQNPALRVLLHDDKASGQVYFLALLAPPVQRPANGSVPREAILLVDHSGSMSGAKWDAADWTVQQFLNGLTPKDTFTLGLFHDKTRWFSPKPLPADTNSIANAIRFLQENKDSGGTNLGVALEQALSRQRTIDERARHILIVTDAEVTDGGRILRLAGEEAGYANRRRISMICIDAAPNSLLATELAERGGGAAKFLTSDPEQADITTALDTLLEEWNAPILTGLRLEINRPKAEAVGKERLKSNHAGGSALDVGDLPEGRAVWIAGRVPHGDSPDLAFRVATAEGKVVTSSRRDLAAPSAQNPAIKALFGARRILGLEFLTTAHYRGKELKDQLERLGYEPDAALVDPDAKSKLYAENVQQDANAALRDLLAREALDYGIVCSETAFVAVREEAGNRIEAAVSVPNALPAGWADSFLSAPAFLAAARHASTPMFDASYAPQTPPTPPASTAPASVSGQGLLGKAMYALGELTGRDASQSRGQRNSFPAVPPITNNSAERVRTEISIDLHPIFQGVPTFINGEALLFDTSRSEDAARLPGAKTLSKLEFRFVGEYPSWNLPGYRLAFLLYVDDMIVPRAKVVLSALVRQGGKRPLHIRMAAGHLVRLVLVDSVGCWPPDGPAIEVFLS